MFKVYNFTKFYAWVGFLTILSAAIYGIHYVVWANQFLAVHGV